MKLKGIPLPYSFLKEIHKRILGKITFNFINTAKSDFYFIELKDKYVNVLNFPLRPLRMAKIFNFLIEKIETDEVKYNDFFVEIPYFNMFDLFNIRHKTMYYEYDNFGKIHIKGFFSNHIDTIKYMTVKNENIYFIYDSGKELSYYFINTLAAESAKTYEMTVKQYVNTFHLKIFNEVIDKPYPVYKKSYKLDTISDFNINVTYDGETYFTGNVCYDIVNNIIDFLMTYNNVVEVLILCELDFKQRTVTINLSEIIELFDFAINDKEYEFEYIIPIKS